MVVQPKSSVRFSVRRGDLNPSHAHPSSASDTCSTRTTSNDNPRQQPNSLKNNVNSGTQPKSHNPTDTQTRQLPERRAKPQLRQPPLSQQSQASTIPSGHERPLKKAKLDGNHEPNAASVAKLPLRSRDSPDLRNGNGTPTIKTTATRTRARAASGSLPSPHVETISTRSSRRDRSATRNPPVVVDENAGRQNASFFPPSNNGVAGERSEGVTPGVRDDIAGSEPSKDAKNVEDKAGRRSLRSHDGGSRSRSELAMYFQNYEQMLSLEPKKPGTLRFSFPQLLRQLNTLHLNFPFSPSPCQAFIE